MADQNQRRPYGDQLASWQLSNLQPVSQGQIIDIREGTLTRQFEIEADAESMAAPGDVPVTARFRLVMDVFAPASDMGGQKRGRYYVQGLWELEADPDTEQTVQEGALTGKIKGRVQADLDFDPTTENRDWKGVVQIPMSRVRSDVGTPGIRPMRGGGELAFTGGEAGALDLNLKLWPKF